MTINDDEAIRIWHYTSVNSNIDHWQRHGSKLVDGKVGSALLALHTRPASGHGAVGSSSGCSKSALGSVRAVQGEAVP